MAAISIASSHQAFLINDQRPIAKSTHPARISCSYSRKDDKDSRRRVNSEKQLAKRAMMTVAVGSVGDASAGKSGGRVGGQAFRPSAPRSSPRINSPVFGRCRDCRCVEPKKKR